jgi:inhibitor of cysteine peptidase
MEDYTDDYTTEREVNVGHEFTIELESNPTTGYRWHPVFDDLLELISNHFTQTSKLIGAGGVECFNFKAIKPGRTTIKMLYNRPGQKKIQKERVFSISISCRSYK